MIKIFTGSLGLVLVTLGANAATVLIDDFDGTQQVVDKPNAEFPNESEEAAAVIGGFRDLAVRTSGAGSSESEARVSGGSAFLSNNASVSGDVTVVYDGEDFAAGPDDVDVDGLGGVDLIDGTNTGFLFDVEFTDAPFVFEFDVWDMLGNFATLTVNAPEIDVPTTVFRSFDDFVGIDFSQVGALEFRAFGGGNFDGQLNSIKAVGVVPLPSGMLLLGTALALGGGVFAGRRRQL